MATDPQNQTPAAAPEQAAEKTAGATPETKAKAARTTARKPRARRAATSRATAARKRADRPTARATAERATPGATAARPTLGRPAGRPAARPAAPQPVAAAAPATVPFGGALLDAVQATGDRVAGYHEQLAEATPLPWFANVARANAELTRVVTRAYVSNGRKLLRS